MHTRLLAALTVIAVTAALGLPAAAQDEGDHATASGVTEERYEETITEEYRFETEHGTMYGVVERPDPEAYPDLYAEGQGQAGPGVPVILVLSPYNTIYQPVAGGPQVLSRGVGEYFVPRGYAYGRFDVVGTRESGGCYDYGGVRERETGAAVVDALGGQDWSNGRVGMIGGSYDGTTQLAAAVEAPEHLVAIIPQVAIDRWYDYAFGAGIRYFFNSERATDEGFDTPLAFDFGFALIPPSDLDPASGEVLAERIDPCDRLVHTQRAYETDPVYDEFWEERDYHRRAANVEAAVLLEGGWLDHNVKHWDTTQFFMALPDDHPKRMTIGQWAHARSQFDDAQDIRHAWFDHWLLGFDTGVMELPAVDTEASDGVRRQEATWPPPGTQRLRMPLVEPAGDDAPPARGELALDPAHDDATYTDEHVGLTEEQMFGGACTDDDVCLLFASAPLEDHVRISGQPLVHLTATSDAQATHYKPVLYHTDADGGDPQIISRGFLNARNRNGLDVSEELTPGEEYAAPVPVWDVDYVVPEGRRLGVVVASTNAVWALAEEEARAENVIDVAGGSFVELPVSAGAGALEAEGPGDGGAGDAGAGAADDRSLPTTGGGLALTAALVLGLGALLIRRR